MAYFNGIVSDAGYFATSDVASHQAENRLIL